MIGKRALTSHNALVIFQCTILSKASDPVTGPFTRVIWKALLGGGGLELQSELKLEKNCN